MRLRDTKLLLLILAVFGFTFSNANAEINVRILLDSDLAINPFNGNITGSIFGPEPPNFFVNSIDDFLESTLDGTPGTTGDIYWQGGTLDSPSGGTTFVNSIGSSSISWGFQNEAFFFQSFNMGFNTFNNPLVFGDNIVSTSVRNGNITDFGPYNETNLVGPAINTFNPNRTATTSNWMTTDGGTVTSELETLAAFWITHEDFIADPTLESFFTPELFSDPSIPRLITREGVISHFLFIIANILDSNGMEPGGDEWTLLYYDFSQNISEDSGMGDDFMQINFGATLVSYDQGAIPTPIPAAAWLFGAGILSMVAFARRKTKVA